MLKLVKYGSFSKVTKVVLKTYNDPCSVERRKEIAFYNEIRNKDIRYMCKMVGEIGSSIVLEDCGVCIIEYLRNHKHGNSRFFVQMSSAVASIHSMDYYHGDLNYTNILVDHDSNIKICDFTASDSINNKHDVKYAHGYEDPDNADPQLYDVYALGIAFWIVYYKEIPPTNTKAIITGFDDNSNYVCESRDVEYHANILDMDMVRSAKYKNIIQNMTGRAKGRPSAMNICEFCLNNNAKQDI